jgi:hypothetical protein
LVVEAQGGREEEEGDSVGGRYQDGVKRARLDVVGDGNGRGPNARAAGAPLLRFGERGLSPLPPLIFTDLWMAMA